MVIPAARRADIMPSGRVPKRSILSIFQWMQYYSLLYWYILVWWPRVGYFNLPTICLNISFKIYYENGKSLGKCTDIMSRNQSVAWAAANVLVMVFSHSEMALRCLCTQILSTPLWSCALNFLLLTNSRIIRNIPLEWGQSIRLNDSGPETDAQKSKC